MLLRRLDRAWSAFRESYAGLSETELLRHGVIGLWSIKDIIAHVTTWEEEALRYLPVILQGGRLPKYSTKYGGIDAFNARATANKKDLSLAEVIQQQDRVHRQLIDLIEAVPDKHLDSKTRFWHRLRADTFGHYAKHAAAIQKWRNRMPN
jgi:hypothetical protein